MTDLKEKLSKYSEGTMYPMHMPGHKRNLSLVSMEDPYALDITEIDGFDDLHHADGVLAEIMVRAANLFRADDSYLLVNGSTCGILAAITAAAKKGDTVLVARNCHKSVYHAMELYGLRPVYLIPRCDPEFTVCGSISPADVVDALETHPEAAMVIVTSPTYEGVVSDITAIAEAAHAHGIPLLVDEAHGAHFAFSEKFPKSAVDCGADLVIQSLHKTLLSLTQTALLHCQGGLISREMLHHQLEIFQSSSPSYILMASISTCLSLLERESGALFYDYEQRLEKFDQSVSDLSNLCVLRPVSLQNHPVFYDCDPGKIVVFCRNLSFHGKPFHGPNLAQILRAKYQIEVEMAAADYIIAMTSVADTDEGFDRLRRGLCEIDKDLEAVSSAFTAPSIILPNRVLGLDQALRLPGDFRNIDNALDQISAEYIYAYPPGIPLIAPGEQISSRMIDAIQKNLECNVELRSTSGKVPDMIRVIVDFNG